MQWYEAEVAQLEKTLKARANGHNPAAFYGSSSIRMWDSMAADLASDRVLNLGFGGSTLAACVHFFERLVPPVKPASLILYAGDNDLGDGCGVDQVVSSFRQFQTKVDKHLPAIPFAFMAIKPSPSRAGLMNRIAKTNAQIADLIAKRQRPGLFIDTFSPMLDAKGKPRKELFLADGLHLSKAGYKVWADVLKPYRHQLLIDPAPDSGEGVLASDGSAS